MTTLFIPDKILEELKNGEILMFPRKKIGTTEWFSLNPQEVKEIKSTMKLST